MLDAFPAVQRGGADTAQCRFLAKAFARLALLQGLSAEEVGQVAALARPRLVPAQRTVFSEGDPSRFLWVLLDGRVRLSHPRPDGRQHIVSFRGPVSALELGPALDGRPVTATATALDESILASIPRQALGTLSVRYPLTIRNVIDQLCLELRQRDIAMAISALHDARGRVGCALLHLAKQFGEPAGDGVRIAFRLSRQDIADISGVTLETAIRILSQLQHQGVVRTRAQIIEIVDVRALSAPAGCHDCQFDCSVFAPRDHGAAVNGAIYPSPA